MFPKPSKAERKRRKGLGQKLDTKARRKLYRILVRPAYLAGLAVGQGRRGKYARCERCGAEGRLEVHHMAGRDGDLVLDFTKLAGLCTACHDDVHEHPQQARDDGWMLSRHQADTIWGGPPE